VITSRLNRAVERETLAREADGQAKRILETLERKLQKELAGYTE
jgi:hypothetical protein